MTVRALTQISQRVRVRLPLDPESGGDRPWQHDDVPGDEESARDRNCDPRETRVVETAAVARDDGRGPKRQSRSRSAVIGATKRRSADDALPDHVDGHKA